MIHTTLKLWKAGKSVFRIALVGACLVLLGSGPRPLCQDCEEPRDATPPPYDMDCGTEEYTLTAWFMGIDYDESVYDADGVCYVYTDCSCGYNNGDVQGYRSIMIRKTVAPYDWEIWWNITSITGPFYTPCTSGTCAGKGVTMKTGKDVYTYAGYDEFCCSD